jgi:ATP-binding cassette subfamily B protein
LAPRCRGAYIAYLSGRNGAIIPKCAGNLSQGQCQLLSIAHRLSSIRDGRNVIAIDACEIVGQGTHQQLLDKHGFFYHLFKSQFKRQEI